MPLQDCPYYIVQEFKNYILSEGIGIICYTPPSCTLNLTGKLIDHVSTRGGNDGEIAIQWTGSTGTTSIYLDGVLDGTTTGDLYDITGLTAGFYGVQIREDDCADEYQDVQVLDGEFRTGDMTIISPTGLTASENPIIFDIRTAESGVGNRAIMELSISNGTIFDGDYFKFELTSPYEYTQYFYAKGFPDKSNYFLASVMTDDNGTQVGSNSRQEIAQSLADAIQQDLLIPKVYTVSYDGLYTVTLIAKETGERFTLSNNNVSDNALFLVTKTIQVGSNTFDGQQVDDYSVYAEVFLNDERLQYPSSGNSTSYVRIAELELPFQTSNNHRFDVASILKNFVYSNRPRYDLTGSTVQPDMMKPYFIRFGEKYPVIKNTNTKKKRFKGTTSIKWVINSSLGHYDANDMNAYGYLGTLSGATISDVKFLTNSPDPKLIQRASQEYLYFILQSEYPYELDVRGDLDFYDGTSVTGATFFTIQTDTGNTAGGVMALNLSYDKLGLAAYETSGSTNRKIKRATFAVYQTSGVTTQKYTEDRAYRFEIEDRPRKFGITFQNVLGGYDAFDFVGIVEQTINRLRGTFTVPIGYNTEGSAGEGFKSTATYDVKVTNKLIVNSGWIDEAHFDWLKELMQSNDIYSYTTVNQNYLNLDTFKYKKSSLDDLYEIEAAFTQTVYENGIDV